MNKKVVPPVAIALVVLVAGGVWAWMSRESAADRNQLTLYGNVDIRQVALAFDANGRIAELRVEEGDRVRAGDVLGILDDRTARLRLARSEAQIGVQEQVLRRLQAGSRPQEIAQARANAAAAKEEAELAGRQVARLRAASEATSGRGVSKQDLDMALAQEKVALARADSAREAAQLVIAGPRQEDIAQAAKQLAAARAERALIQRQLDESQLRAPIDAVVRSRLLEPGDMASPQRPVLTLAITQPKWVRAYVPEQHLGQIHPGMAASVTTDAEPDRSIAARVGYISSVAEFTPKTIQTEELRTSLVYEVRFSVDDPRDQLRLGMPATVHLKLAPGDSARPAR